MATTLITLIRAKLELVAGFGTSVAKLELVAGFGTSVGAVLAKRKLLI